MSRPSFAAASLALTMVLGGCSASAGPAPARPTLELPRGGEIPTPTEPGDAPSPSVWLPGPNADPTNVATPETTPVTTPETMHEPDPTEKPEPTNGGGYAEATTYRVGDVDLKMVLPGGWLGVDADNLEALSGVPAIAETLDELENTVLVFAGVDLRGVDGSPPGDNLTVYDMGEPIPPLALAIAAEALAVALEGGDYVKGDVSVAMVSLPIGEATRLRFTYQAEVTLTVEAYAFNSGNHFVLAAFTAPADQESAARNVFQDVANSFREI